MRRLTDQEGQRLQQIVRRGSTSSVRYRRAMMLLASAGGNRVPVIAQLMQADEDTVRDVIHRFNEIGLACLDPQWAGGRPRLLSRDDEDFVVRTATTRPTKLGQAFTRWSLRKLVAYLRKVHGRMILIGREALRCLLARRGVTFQRTKTWKESPDPERDTKLDRIEEVLDRFPDRVFAFDEFGRSGSAPAQAGAGRDRYVPTGFRPPTTPRTGCATSTAATRSATTACGASTASGRAPNTLAALKSIRAARPDGAPIYVIMDNLSAHKGADICRWARKHKAELCFTPTYASWANPIEAHVGPLRQFTIANLNYPNHTVQTRALRAYLHWRNANARHRDVLAAERKERARIRSEKGIRWGGRPLKTAACPHLPPGTAPRERLGA
ncbi:IS630 family transposase [Streptomyces sp. NPDC088847]|uniref:IS630 family transposase n=1 Tax=Streptomyces sp. NPDC088847 TaxID=3365909 RepID=UPI0037F54C31